MLIWTDMLRHENELQNKFLAALRLQENEFAEIARRKSVNDLRYQSMASGRDIKLLGKFRSEAEAEQIRRDEEYARKISMELAGIEYNPQLATGSNPLFVSPDVPAPQGYAYRSRDPGASPRQTGFHGSPDIGVPAYHSLQRTESFPEPAQHAYVHSSPPLSNPSDHMSTAYREDSSLVPDLPLRPARGTDRDIGSLLTNNVAPNDWPGSAVQELSDITATLQPNRPSAPAFGAPEVHYRPLPSEPGSMDEPLQAMRGPSPRESLAICEQCLSEQPFVSYCPACSFHFCRDHWEGQPLHHGQRLVNGVPHEKTDPLVARKIKSIIEPSISEEEQNLLHRADDDTTWFGVLPDATDSGQRLLHDFGRYEEFLSQSNFSPKSRQFPSLISFVGPTGAGKSTIVKGLVKLPESNNVDLRLQTPVVGLVQHQAVPTSGEVHLYWDPSSLKSARPLLYADCEGLGGGSREPMAARATKEKKTLTKERRNSNQSRHTSLLNPGLRQSMLAYSSMSPRNTPMPPTPAPQSQSSLGYFERASTQSYSPYSPVVEQNEAQDGWTPGSGKVYRGITRKITWAQDRDRRSRQFIVENLYPRLLYTFSDIVVLVMRNPKSVSIDTYARRFR
jgi:energy-coupling factor transporter ATP-binding protein EcfA2